MAFQKGHKINLGKKNQKHSEFMRLNNPMFKKENRDKSIISHIGLKRSEEHRKNISKSLIGKPKSEEHRRNLSLAKIGKKIGPHSEETKIRMSIAKKGIPMLETTKQKLSLSAKERYKDENYRKKCSETKKRLFAEGKIKPSFLGKQHTEESKKKLSEKAKLRIGSKNPFYGRKHSEESKQKIRLAKIGKPNLASKGKPKSEEQKRKSSETKKRLFAEGKTKSWNKGLTKETDERVLKGALNMIGKNAGEKCHTFNNWSSLKPYTKDFNSKFKREVKERDGCCMLCNLDFDDLKLLKRCVHVHHIDYNKLNSFPQNCITLCNPCHTKTNFNRKQWILFFQSLLKERYDYEYSEEQKIIFDFKSQKGGVII